MDSEPDVLDSVELFGCGDSSSGSSNSSNNIHLPPFPGGGVYLTAGAHIPPAVSGGEGKVLVCGGYGCSLIEETSANSTKYRNVFGACKPWYKLLKNIKLGGVGGAAAPGESVSPGPPLSRASGPPSPP